MTGNDLLNQLSELTPTQRNFEVLLEGENKFRDTIFMSTSKNIRLAYVYEDGVEEKTKKKKANCILIESF